ncbi:hypothetical protein [Nocardia abscessus]|uniref:hypothetical protein n=1 Tax=Nocardia abscessus TaxID=120957 RepID=UPI00245674D2|nr:hypothetical protein [Nocardia abscessus]
MTRTENPAAASYRGRAVVAGPGSERRAAEAPRSARPRHLTVVGQLVDAWQPLTVEQRRERLEARISLLSECATCEVQVRGDLSVVVVLSGPAPRHLIHAALTVITAGAWSLIWLAVARQRRPLRVRLSVDEAGHVRGTAWE